MANNTPQVWSPLKEIDRFRRDFDDLFDRLLGGRLGAPAQAGMIAPALESFLKDNVLIVRADLPGIDPKNVEVTVTGDVLTLRGKREQTSESQTKGYLHREVSYGSFERTLQLPEGVKTEEIKAAYRNGVLELAIPVPPGAGARKVPIQIEGAPPKKG